MPDTTELVVNTGPIIAMVAALGDLRVLQIYDHVWVPMEVCQDYPHARSHPAHEGPRVWLSDQVVDFALVQAGEASTER